jgi:hypothetical protein
VGKDGKSGTRYWYSTLTDGASRSTAGMVREARFQTRVRSREISYDEWTARDARVTSNEDG